jgi:hypothetical protein
MCSQIFTGTPLTWEAFAPALDTFTHVDWRGLKESFLTLDVTENDPATGIGIDWFDDAAWGAALQKVGFCARLVKMAGVRGFMLDDEEYSSCAIFEYPQQKLAATKSFNDYANQAFFRGQQFAKVCQKECPDMAIIIPHGPSELLLVTHPPYSPQNTRGSLVPAFVDGMLSVDGPKVIDGYESSYMYRTPREFLEGDWQMNETAAFSRNPELYRKKMGKGFGVWIDAGDTWNAKNQNANYFSPANFENALHWALQKGSYVWIYTNRVNWLRGMTFPKLFQPSAAYDEAIKNSRLPHDPTWLPANP